MEIRRTANRVWRECLLLVILFLVCPLSWSQGPVQKYSMRDGKMVIELASALKPSTVDSFLQRFGLSDLPIIDFMKTRNGDSLQKLGWVIEKAAGAVYVISKKMGALENITKSADQLYTQRNIDDGIFPSVNNGISIGYNRFRNKNAFTVKEGVVQFFLRGNAQAGTVKLAASFTDWSRSPITMTKVDSGWIANVVLKPGKYWYKFIIDGNWVIDSDNALAESDGHGNVNSVFFRPNVTFRLEGFNDARKVYLAGSFNGWKQRDLLMIKTGYGWELPVYLANGTHTYKFIVDGNWYSDKGNSAQLPDGVGGYNSVIRLGNTYTFRLKGFNNAKQVFLSGSFNGWKEDELQMTKTADGWELPYYIGPGNYEYRYRVDGKWVTDPDNPLTDDPKNGNSYQVIEPNYTFRLKSASARTVYLAGDFNGWSPKAFPMKRVGEEWVFPVHLSAGKHRYKFIVDGKWILDPANKLWEQNEFDTGNSVLWIGE